MAATEAAGLRRSGRERKYQVNYAATEAAVGGGADDDSDEGFGEPARKRVKAKSNATKAPAAAASKAVGGSDAAVPLPPNVSVGPAGGSSASSSSIAGSSSAAASDAEGNSSAASKPVTKWERYFRRLQGILTQLRYLRAFMITYERESQKRDSAAASSYSMATSARAKPKNELLEARRKVVDYKKKARELIFAIDSESDGHSHWNVWGKEKVPSTSRAATAAVESVMAAKRAADAQMASPSAASSSAPGNLLTPAGSSSGSSSSSAAAASGGDADSDDGIEAEDIACSACGSFDSTDDNDILLCDYGPCGLAYHQQCMDPPLTSLPPEGQDWLCPRVRYCNLLPIYPLGGLSSLVHTSSHVTLLTLVGLPFNSSSAVQCSCLIRCLSLLNDEEHFQQCEEAEEEEGVAFGAAARVSSSSASPSSSSSSSSSAGAGAGARHRELPPSPGSRPIRFDRVEDVYAEMQAQEAALKEEVSRVRLLPVVCDK